MFFVLAKVFGFFALPSNLLMTLGLFGVLLLATRFSRAGVRLLVVSVVLIAVLGLSPVGHLVITLLEQRFPAWDPRRGAPDGIVVLGGSFDTLVGPVRGEVSLNEAAERVTVVAELARRYPKARIVFSGGSGRLIWRGVTEATLATRLFDSFGIPRDHFTVEDRSRDTYENAVFSKELANPQPGERWLLVTSAYHMPRAMGAFRQVGFAVEPHPVDWRTRGHVDWSRPFNSVADGLKRVDTAAHEWVGLAVYWLNRRSSEFLPGVKNGGCDTGAPEGCRQERGRALTP